MKWYEQGDMNGSRWFYDCEPCSVLAVGVKDGQKSPCVLRVQLVGGETLEVISNKDGKFPRVTFVVDEAYGL